MRLQGICGAGACPPQPNSRRRFGAAGGKHLHRLPWVALALLCASCATTDAATREPDVVVKLETKARASHCGAQIEVLLGGVPEGAQKLTDGVLTSKKPQPQERYERYARAIAKQQCVDGVSILSAEEIAGGLVHADIVLWLWP